MTKRKSGIRARRRMRVSPQRRMQLRVALQNGVFVLLLVSLAAILGVFSRHYRVAWDLTTTGRNTLSSASLDTLRKLDGPVQVTAYATPQDPRLGDLRKHIADFIARYQRAKPDVLLEFIDPRSQPKAAAQAGVRVNGELVVEYAGRSERLSNLSELDFTNLLIRLARADERLVMWLEGHGERSLTGPANHDLGDFGKQLRSKGIELSSLNLALAPDVPDNAALLVIASPQTRVSSVELDKLVRHIERGGNLLWLIDQEPLHGLEPLAERLGLVLSPGVVVDPDAIERASRPVMAVATPAGYGSHPIVRSFRLNTLFPFVRAIAINPAPGWDYSTLIEVAPRGWIETGDLGGRIVFDAGRDIPGPVPIALALERLHEEKNQRIVVIGSAHFLANTYLGNGGNLDLGVNIVNWLTGDDRLIAIQPRSAPDVSLTLSRGWLAAIVVVFLIVMPLALVAAGAWIWWRRRAA
ncbi:MAG: GldG family protein [Burkholderiales bacterium]|nr:GldG family protein [Burkholderiales bacterium]